MSDKTVLKVTGMTCSSCAQGITKHLDKKGFKDTNVFYENGEVEVSKLYRDQIPEIISQIESLGYKANLEKEEKFSDLKPKYSKTEIRFLISILFTIPLLLPMFFTIPFLHLSIVQFILCLPVVYIGLIHFGKSAIGSLRNKMPNMDVLIAIGSITAFIYSTIGWILSLGMNYMFFETSATIISLVLLGNIIEERSLKKTTSSLELLTKFQPQTAKRISNPMEASERTNEISIDLLNKNDLILINAGDKIPADGLIYWGNAIIDESAMTGESLPVEKSIDDLVLAGTILVDGNIKIIVHQCGKETILSSMIDMVKYATFKKPSIQRKGDKMSAWFVPSVIAIAVITFFTSFFILSIGLKPAILNSIAILVVSCPCAMGLATPTAVAVGIGRAAKNGILIKGGDILERLSEIDTIVFDKTGTLTDGNFQIQQINYFDKKEIIDEIFSSLEQYSTHPIAKSINSYYSKITITNTIHFSNVKEEKGIGIHADDKEGNQYTICSYKGAKNYTEDKGHQVYLLKNNELIATIDISDNIRKNALETISYFKSKGIKTILLSGDNKERCEYISKQLLIDECYYEQSPIQKSEFITSLNKLRKAAMLGDGINDAASLSAAFVGISMGSGTQIAISSSDIVLMNSKELKSLEEAYQLSVSTISTIKSNLNWAIFYNLFAIPIAAFGFLSPMIGSLSMAFSDVVVIGNSLRLNKKKIGLLK